jgi:hypothetical protein
MGTMVGLYESALDELCARKVGEAVIRPMIVASTATVRRAENQIRALFCRRTVDIFPPPGPDRRDSFFACTYKPQESHARLYLGVAAQGRSLKVVLLRVYLALLGAAQKWYAAHGGKKNKDNPADPYMTLLGYFNSLRELGGSRRIIEDEVSTQITNRSNRKREGEKESPFADRTISYEPVELASRVSTDKVAAAKRQLALPFHEDGRVDVAIATNMISVGLDITRLGLMVVLGQPKTSAEYVQATSRVGREQDKPGLVVTIQNIHRPRDRSHYERFAFYSGRIAAQLQQLHDEGMKPQHLALLAGAIIQTRLRQPQQTDQVDLVWTGPESLGVTNRDTGVVVRDLFGGAESEVLVAGFAIYQGRDVFKRLAERMAERPALQVKFFLDVHRAQLDTSPSAELLRRFAHRFQTQEWPGGRLQELYYDPRSLDTDAVKRSSLHAKCIVVDRQLALVTSANFTEAAQTRNIEVGALIRAERFAAQLAGHFEAPADAGLLKPIPIVGEVVI